MDYRRKSLYFWPLIVFFLILGIYLSWLALNIVFIRELSKFETEISPLQENLIQNRLNVVNLAKLDPNVNSFSSRKDEIFTQINNTNSFLLTEVDYDNTPKLKVPITKYHSNVTNINNTLSNVMKETKIVLEAQKIVLDKAQSFDSIVANAFSYNPYLELSEDIENGNFNAIGEKASQAKLGLSKIKSNLSQNGHLEIFLLNKTIENFEFLENAARNRNQRSVEDIAQDIYANYKELKNILFAEELNIMFTDDQVLSLTKASNLITNLNYISVEINHLRTSIGKSLHINPKKWL